MTKTKPKFGFNASGFNPSHRLSMDTIHMIKELNSAISITELESCLGTFIYMKNIHKQKPTLSERRANLKYLEKTITNCLKLISREGIDQISRDHIKFHLINAKPAISINDIKSNLQSLRCAVIKEYKELEDQSGGRPKENYRKELAENIANLLCRSGIKVTTTKTGEFARCLEIVLEEVGESKEDVSSLCREAVRNLKRAE